jgi:hypothetical protein
MSTIHTAHVPLWVPYDQSKLAIDHDCAKLKRPGKAAATGPGELLAMSWLLGLRAATVFGNCLTGL